MSVNFNPTTQSIVNETKKALENDGRLDKKEFETLKKMIKSSDLPKDIKDGAIKFLEQTKKDSTGFLGIFGRDISSKEVSQLKELSAKMGNNPLAKEFCSIVESTHPQKQADTNHARTHKSHDSEPSGNFISRLFSHKHSEKSDSINSGSAKLNENKSDFYVSQGNGLPSHASDCGPSCATMVLKRFGIFGKGTTGAEGVTKIRKLLGQMNHAIDESQIKKSIESLSGGRIKEKFSESFSKASSVINNLKDRLSKGEMPILLTGSPYHDGDPSFQGRHYMVVTGVDNNGNIQLADPGGKFNSMSPERLQHLMDKTSNSTSILSFNA